MGKQYAVGEYMVHENDGVCEVIEISEKALQGKGSERLYYSLEPISSRGSVIITPVDTKVRIRDVAGPDQIEDVLNRVSGLAIIEEENSRARGELYKEEISKFSMESLARVLKTVYFRRELRLAQGKKVMSSDEKVYTVAAKKLFEEMAFSTGKDVSEIEEEFFLRLAEAKDEYIKENA